MLRTELLRNPYLTCKRLRRESPVCRLEPEGPWLIARHADVLSVLKDPVRFRSSRPARESNESDPEFLLRTRGLVGADPPEHTRLRGLIKNAFAPARMRILEERIRCLARDWIRVFIPRGRFELVNEFAKPFPMAVITLLMGVRLEEAQDFGRWADLLVTWGSPECLMSEEEAMKIVSEMHEYFSREIAERSGKDGDDLISTLAGRMDDGERAVAPRELIAFLRLLLVAGSETTTHLIGNTVLALLAQTGLWSAVQNERRRIPDLIEESLRFDSPVPSLIRWASIDTSVGGVTIRKNEAVMPLLASANHDETVFLEPERFDLDRSFRPHLSFGAGPHYCLGVVLARLQVQIVFEELFDTFSRIESADTEPILRVESFFVRGPSRLDLYVDMV